MDDRSFGHGPSGKCRLNRSNMEPIVTTFAVALAVIVGIVLIWLFPLKLAYRLKRRFGEPVAYPFRFAWALNLRVRRWQYRFVLDRLDLRSGMVVLEVGAGVGTFTIPAARRVGSAGKIISVDLQPEMIAKLERNVRRAGITNVVTKVAGAYELPLEDSSVDCVFFVAVIGEIAEPQRALGEAYRVLKSDGMLSITEDFVDPDYKLPGETARLVERAGFKITDRFGSFWLYTLNGRKTQRE